MKSSSRPTSPAPARQDQETLESITTEALDEARVEAFAGRLFGLYGGGMVALIIDLAHRTGLLEAAAQGSGTSADLADRAGLTERYARECLGSQVTAGIIDYDRAARTYQLPAEHAVVLTGPGSLNLAPLSQVPTLLAHHVDGVAQVARDGGGVPYEAFRPAFTEVMDGLSRSALDGQLIEGILPSTGALTTRSGVPARRPTPTGWATPPSRCSTSPGCPPSRRWTRCSPSTRSTTRSTPQPCLARIFDALTPGGMFVMVDIKAHSNLEDNLDNPFAPMLYAISTLHCTTVSLAHDGAGLGTVWGEELARTMLAGAGFVDVEVHDVPDDPMNVVYVTHKPV